MQIVPSIIGERIEQIREKAAKVSGLVDWVQVDIVDGLFAIPPSWPYRRNQKITELKSVIEGLPTLKFELHLMIENPESSFADWFLVGAHRILIHRESTPHAEDIIEKGGTVRIAPGGHGRVRILCSPVQMGLVLCLDTSSEILDDFATPLQFIQLMSIEKIGSYGAAFNDAVLPKIEYLRRKFPKATISVDGGIKLENVGALTAAGANNLVVGSAIWNAEDIRATIKRLQKIK